MNAVAATTMHPTRGRLWTTIALVAMLLASMASAAIGTPRASAQESTQSLASAVPADTVMYMSMNLDQTSPQWELAFQLLDRAGLSEVAESEAGISTDEIGDVAEQNNFTGSAAIVFTDADALVSMTSSELPAAAMDTTAEMDPQAFVEDVPEGFAMIMQPDDPAALAEQFLTNTTSEATDFNAELLTTEYNGVTITYWESTEPGMSGSATAEVDGTVVLATRASDIEPIIDAVQGNVDNLASVEGFTTVGSKLEADNLMFGYMNMEVMVDAAMTDPSLADLFGEAMMPEELEASKGHMGWVMYASDAGFHMDAVVVPNDPSTMPDPAAYSPTLTSAIPADVMLFAGSTNFYGTGVTEMLGTLMQTALAESTAQEGTPAATPTMEETWALFELQLGFNPDTDLVAHLDGEYATYVGLYDYESGFPTPEFLFVSETSDAASLDETMTQVTNTVNMLNEGTYEISSRTVEGGELTVVTMDAETTDGIPLVLEFGVVNDHMLIGANGAIDRYLDGGETKLADDATFQSTMALLPSENVVSVGYINVEGQVMPLLDWLTTSLMSSMSTLDNHEDCGQYATQGEAQTAYDADPGTLWLLDMDFDGEACEDFFGEAAPAATPESFADVVNVPAAGLVTWVDADAVYVSSILVIGD